MDEEVLRELRKKKTALWIGIIFFGIIALSSLMTESVLMFICGILLVAGCIYGLIVFGRFTAGLLKYQPGKGFGYYRKTREQKLKHMTVGQFILAAVPIVTTLFGYFSFSTIIGSIIAILFIQFHLKRRVSLHTPVDDATLFELEELEIVSTNETVYGLYKDFHSWNAVPAGGKIFVLTLDRLVIIRFLSVDQGQRIDIRLSDIDRLGIIAKGRDGSGLLLTIGTIDYRIIRLSLDGESDQDSPEEFVTHFLQALDNALISRGSPAGQTAAGNRNPAEQIASRGTIRHIEMNDMPSTQGGQPAAQQNGQRVLDF